MQITVDKPGSVVSLAGRLSSPSVADVRDVLTDALEHGEGDLVVDLSGVELLDASGLGVLVGTHRRALREERRLVLRDVPERIDRLLAVTRLHRVLTIEHSVAV